MSNEIPTPETDQARSYIPDLIAKSKDLERRLAIITEHIGLCQDAIGESRDSDTAKLYKYFEGRKLAVEMAHETLTKTTNKQ